MIRTRRGVSLVELLIVMSGCTVVLTMTSGLVCRIMRTQIESRAHENVERNSLRLADHFRRDVHVAQTAETSKDKLGEDAFLRLERDDGWRAEYSLRDGIVVRQLDNDSHEAWEEFTFPEACDLSIERGGAPVWVRLTITSQPLNESSIHERPLKPARSIPVFLQAEALLGRDSRFTEAHSRQEDER